MGERTQEPTLLLHRSHGGFLRTHTRTEHLPNSEQVTSKVIIKIKTIFYLDSLEMSALVAERCE